MIWRQYLICSWVDIKLPYNGLSYSLCIKSRNNYDKQKTFYIYSLQVSF